MELHNLKPAKGSTHSEKRLGRGQASGTGGTAGRGHNGAKSRSGYSRKRAFEGGQMPLQMRLPKRGFKSPNRIEYVAINVSKLQAIAEKLGLSDINAEVLCKNGYIKKTEVFKVLGSGDITMKVSVTANAVSETAKSKIEAQGGSVNLV
ncbi:MAG: 50S ribosomal protein L15 [Saprospiraceae bacterium]|jgi:large subunit ribosomal protein L15|tara:strand:+ start:3916 stop:4362 length:447 start_codon:yes stop_codon:yes gene_type:complete